MDIEGDGETIPLPTCFDAIFSRFGVMAFADPVAPFANLVRQALADRDGPTGVALRAATWIVTAQA